MVQLSLQFCVDVPANTKRSTLRTKQRAPAAMDQDSYVCVAELLQETSDWLSSLCVFLLRLAQFIIMRRVLALGFVRTQVAQRTSTDQY